MGHGGLDVGDNSLDRCHGACRRMLLAELVEQTCSAEVLHCGGHEQLDRIGDIELAVTVGIDGDRAST